HVVLHGPAGDALVRREIAALPQRTDRILFEVAGAVAVAHHHGRTVGAHVVPRRRSQHAHDILDGVARGELLHDLDDPELRGKRHGVHAADATRAYVTPRHIRKAGFHVTFA